MDPRHPQKVHYLLRYEAKGKDVKRLELTSLIPASINGIQTIISREFNLTPNFSVNAYGDTVGTFYFMAPSDSVIIEIQGEAILFPGPGLPQDSVYLSMISILETVGKDLRYQLQSRDLPLDSALAQGRGDCSEFAAYAARLCAQKGYPFRQVSGIHLRNKALPTHSWTECQHPNGTWAHLDPTWAAGNPNDPGIAMIQKLTRPSWYLTIDPHEATPGKHRWVTYRYEGDTLTLTTKAEITPIP